MKINSYLLLALLVIILLSSTLADNISKQETTTQTKEALDAPEEAKASLENQGEAKETAEHNVEAKGDERQNDINSGGGGGNYGGGGGGNYGGGGCRHGCCQGYRGRCNRCCTSPEEAKAFSLNKEANDDEGKYGVNYGGGGGNYGGGGSRWGGGCRHGCCQGYGGKCNRCCTSPEEAKTFSLNKQANGDEGKYGVNYGGGGGNYGGSGSGWGGGCRHGCCQGYGGRCNRCCTSPEEAKAFSLNKQANGDEGKYGVNYGGGGSGWGGGCRHGCCQGYGGKCNRCCTSPEEAKAFSLNKQANGDEGKYGVNYGGGGGNYGGGGSGWGGGCRHGCCYQGHGGSCNRCCASPEDAKAFAENQSRP